jgi:hypothetical protein
LRPIAFLAATFLAASGLPVAAHADTTAAWSELDGNPAATADADAAGVVVIALDGAAQSKCGSRHAPPAGGSSAGTLFNNDAPRRDVACTHPTTHLKVAPGAHDAMVASTRLSHAGQAITQAYTFDAAPCTRYRLAAKHAGKGASTFTVAVAAEEPIEGCVAPAAETAAPAAPVAPVAQ